jgi:hypothetical protein
MDMKRNTSRMGLAAGLLALAVTAAAPALAQRHDGSRNDGYREDGRGGRTGAHSFDIGYIDGLRVNHAQAHLKVNGFAKARSIGLGGRQWDLWFNREFREACAGFTSFNGVVSDVRFFSEADCGVGATPAAGRVLRPAELEGLRVEEAQRRLRLSDYTHARNFSQNGRQWDLWRNPRSRTSCVGFTSYNGQVTRADGFSDRECEAYSDDRPGWSHGGGQGAPASRRPDPAERRRGPGRVEPRRLCAGPLDRHRRAPVGPLAQRARPQRLRGVRLMERPHHERGDVP